MFVNICRVVLFLFISSGMTQLFAAEKPILAIQNWTTHLGTPVYFVRTPELPMVDLQVVFDAGSARDANKPGLAKLTNEALSSGTTTKNVNQIAASFDDVGAVYAASISRDMAVVALRSLSDPKFLKPALASFKDILGRANFPDKEYTRIKNQLLNALEEQEEQPASVAAKAFYNAVYDNNPYGHPIAGTSSSVSKLTANDLRNFYKTTYTAQNALIAIVGNIDKSQAQEMAESISQALNQGKKQPPLNFQLLTAKTNKEHIAFPSSQTHIIIGEASINRASPLYFPALVGNYILGGGILTSRLFAEVRDKRGLAYNVRSQLTAMRDKGPFIIELQTRNNEASNAIKVVNDTLSTFVKSGPTVEELDQAKKNLTQSFTLKLASNSAIIGQLVTIGYFNLPLNYLDTYKTNISAVTDQQIRAVFNDIVKPNQLVTITVGNNTGSVGSEKIQATGG